MASNFGGKKAAPFGKKGEKATPFGGKPKPKKSGPAKGPNTPIKRYPAEASPAAPEGESAPSASAPDVSRSTNRGGKPNEPTAEPKLSPEAEAARSKRGAVTVLTATGPGVTPPPDPRTSYQVGDTADNTPLISFTVLASAATKKGNPAAALPAPKANADLKRGKAAVAAAAEAESDEPEQGEAEPEPETKKPPFRRK